MKIKGNCEWLFLVTADELRLRHQTDIPQISLSIDTQLLFCDFPFSVFNAS